MPLIYDAAAKKHGQNGMPDEDMDKIQAVATSRNEILMFRSTGPWAKSWIDAGHPTKNMDITAKSSDWGPMAGLIPYDAELSKLTLDKPEKIKAAMEKNEKVVKAGKIFKVPLVLSQAQLAELSVNKDIPPRKAVDEVSAPTLHSAGWKYLFAKKPDKDGKPGKEYVFAARPTPHPKPGFYEILDFRGDKDAAADAAARAKARAEAVDVLAVNAKSNEAKAQQEALQAKGKPLYVLAYKADGKPITGDYDMFAVCPSWGSYSANDQKSFRFADSTLKDKDGKLVFPPVFQQRLEKYQVEVNKDKLKDMSLMTEAWKKRLAWKGDLIKAGKDFLDLVCAGVEDPTKPAGSLSCKVCARCIRAKVPGGGYAYKKCTDGKARPLVYVANPAKYVADRIKGKLFLEATERKGTGDPNLYKFKKIDEPFKCADCGEKESKVLIFEADWETCPYCGGKPKPGGRTRDYEDYDDPAAVAPKMGNVTWRIVEVVLELKAKLAGQQRVWHNAETGRPDSDADVEECFPITTFHPTPLKLPGEPAFKIAVINDVKDLIAYWKKIFIAGYFVPDEQELEHERHPRSDSGSRVQGPAGPRPSSAVMTARPRAASSEGHEERARPRSSACLTPREEC